MDINQIELFFEKREALSVLQPVDLSGYSNPHRVQLYIQREDLLHPELSGNKFRKLKYNILKAKELNASEIITLGGAFSNHIAATAAAGKLFDIKTLGIIRGEEPKILSKTLEKAKKDGMQLYFISREEYQSIRENNWDLNAFSNNLKLITPNSKLQTPNSKLHFIPEGGANKEGFKGVQEGINDKMAAYNYVVSPCGTGSTIAGIISKLQPAQIAIGISVLKGDFMHKNVEDILHLNAIENKHNWEIIPDYHFGGYAKTNPELKSFVKTFYQTHQIPLDLVYTGKMMFAILNLIEQGYFLKESKILAIHTGGLQGNPEDLFAV